MLNFFTKRTVASSCALVVLAVGFSGCSSSVKTWPVTHTAANGKMQLRASTRVAEGETLTVQLPTEGGAAYVWRLAPQSFQNENVVLQSRLGQRASDGRAAGIGEPAMDVFTFHATDVGSTTLVFTRDQGLLPDRSKLMNMTLNIEVFDAQAEARAAAEAQAIAAASDSE